VDCGREGYKNPSRVKTIEATVGTFSRLFDAMGRVTLSGLAPD